MTIYWEMYCYTQVRGPPSGAVPNRGAIDLRLVLVPSNRLLIWWVVIIIMMTIAWNVLFLLQCPVQINLYYNYVNVSNEVPRKCLSPKNKGWDKKNIFLNLFIKKKNNAYSEFATLYIERKSPFPDVVSISTRLILFLSKSRILQL